MEITFANTKEMKCYEAFVKNPTDRTCRRKFCKIFTDSIADEAHNRYNLLLRFPNALAYNKIYGASDNRIELKAGTKDKNPLILKVRVTGAYRKFFHVVQPEDSSYLPTKEWHGQFEEVTNINVLSVTKHDYRLLY